MNHVYHVDLRSDSLVIVNGSIVYTDDHSDKPQLYGTSDVAENIAGALGVEVKAINLVLPADFDEDWTYDDVLALLIENGMVNDPHALKEHELTYATITDDGFVLQGITSFQAEDVSHAVEQLHDSLRGTGEHLLCLSGQSEKAHTETADALTHLLENEYLLRPTIGTNANIYAGNVQLSLKLTSEGVIVDAYQKGGSNKALGTLAIDWFDACEGDE